MLTRQLGLRVHLGDYSQISFSKPNYESNKDKYRVDYVSRSSSIPNVTLSVTDSKNVKVTENNVSLASPAVTCKTYEWKNKAESFNFLSEFEDCVSLDGAFWYGQAEVMNFASFLFYLLL